MGTSKGYQPPKGYLWSNAKRAVSNMVNNNFDSDSIGKAVGQYNQAAGHGSGSGGSRRQQVLSAAGGKAANFLSSARSQGFTQALEKAGLSNLIGKTNEEIYSGLLDYFTGDGGSLDDAIVRDSMAELMKELFLDGLYGKTFEEIIADLDMNKFIKDLITKFVQKDFITNFSEKIEAKCKNIEGYKKAEKQIKDFIRVKIDSKYTVEDLTNIDWQGDEGRDFINQRSSEVLKVFEVYLEG